MSCNGYGADAKTPYEELDSDIVYLVRALNSFDGIQTIGSCGGHPDPEPYQEPEGSWRIAFKVSPCEHGWFPLEFLTWFINNKTASKGRRIILLPHASPRRSATPPARRFSSHWTERALTLIGSHKNYWKLNRSSTSRPKTSRHGRKNSRGGWPDERGVKPH